MPNSSTGSSSATRMVLMTCTGSMCGSKLLPCKICVLKLICCPLLAAHSESMTPVLYNAYPACLHAMHGVLCKGDMHHQTPCAPSV
jgi:hypothetical protein